MAKEGNHASNLSRMKKTTGNCQSSYSLVFIIKARYEKARSGVDLI